jgi:hypothetical protein
MATTGNAEKVRLEAYYLWEREGRPDGKADIHWHAAEAQVEGPSHGHVETADHALHPEGGPIGAGHPVAGSPGTQAAHRPESPRQATTHRNAVSDGRGERKNPPSRLSQPGR